VRGIIFHIFGGVMNQRAKEKYLIMHILHLGALLSALLGYGKKMEYFT
jgi:hypothetical protein